MKEYILWFEDESWFWQLTDKHEPQTEIVGPYDSEIQAMVSILAYAAKVDL